MCKGKYPKIAFCAVTHNHVPNVYVPVFPHKRSQMKVDISAPRSNSGLGYWIPQVDGELTMIQVETFENFIHPQ